MPERTYAGPPYIIAKGVAMKVTVVIPTKNEEGNLLEVIERVRPYADEILVVDGHSTDKTREVAEAAGVRIILDNKKGKGAALRHVINFVNTEITVFIDADGSHDPEDIPKLTYPLLKGEADMVVASRLMGGSSELHGGFDEFFRLAGSSFITAMINWRFKVKLSESQNGFRAIKTDIMKQLGLVENITTIEQEITMKTLKKGFRIAEVPSHEHTRKMGYSKISVKKVAFRYVYTLFKYLFF